MNDTMKNISIFAVGALIGSLVTWKCVKDKYKKIADDEISEMREYYQRRHKEVIKKEAYDEADNDTSKDETPVFTDKDRYDYTKVLNDLKYASNTVNENKSEEKRPLADVSEIDDNSEWPYVIAPEEVGDCGYDVVTYTLWADGILTDELNDIVTNVQTSIGFNALEEIGKYEDDSVHVRNDRLHIDYEVLVDLRAYEDVITHSIPDKAED